MQQAKHYFSFFLVLMSLTAYTKNYHKTDSLTNLLQVTNDSSRIPILLSLSWDLRNSVPNTSIKYGLEAIDLAVRYKDYENLAKAHSFVGVAYRVLGDFSKSIDYYYKGLEIAKQYSIIEQEGFAYLNLASLHIYQEHYAIAKENIKKAEVIANRINNKEMLAYVYVYYGSALQFEEYYNDALEFYQKALAIRIESNHIFGQGACYKHIGDIYFETEQYDKAIENYNKSLEKFKNLIDKNIYADILIKKAQILIDDNNLKQASVLAHQSLEIGKQIGAKLIIRDALQTLATISIKTKDFNSASKYLQGVISYNDSLFNQKLSEKIFSIEYHLETELRESKIELLNKDYAIKELQIKRIKFFNTALSIIIILLTGIFIGALVLLNIRRKRTMLLEKQNQEIISQQNSIEQKNKWLNEANQKLTESEENLNKLIKTKDKLFSIIAHDLRSPFVAMVGLTSVLQKKASKINQEDISKYAFHINDSSQKLLNLIDNLLQWSRSQTGKLKLTPQTLSIKSLADEVLYIMKNQAEVKKITFKNYIPDNFSVFADYDSLSTVIRNLVSNSIKFTRENGSVTLSAYQQSNKINILVSDTGVGISPDNLNKIFAVEEKFTTIGTNQESGSGLGLLICKEFVEQNGGSIHVESKPGEGTTFTISLPQNS